MTSVIRKQVHKTYGNRIRIRVCGCLLHDSKLLMLKHDGIGEKGYFWNVPGGEPEGQESLVEALKREFLEETGLKVAVGELLCLNEYIESPLHAVEYYFEVRKEGGHEALGHDPENVTVLSKLDWFTKEEFSNLDNKTKPIFLLNNLDFD
ncbi:MAG: 8-oxo-dGTP diphosphatase [Algoriphagus sp.]|jgi:8-oxo-dGTP diphosphatase